MGNMLEILKSDIALYTFMAINIILLVGFIIMIVKLSNSNKKYNKFIKKLGNGNNIQEDLENYMYRVERVEKQNAEILDYIKTIQNDLTNCIQKVGMVRYTAFKDTGSDLSFALALLDENNNGVVLNGIYSREMSNIYAKPVENGKSSYTVSEEENEAIRKAMESKNVYKVK